MTKNPDKYIRKAIRTVINNLFPVYDYTVGSTKYENKYMVISTQTKQQGTSSKCGTMWDCSVLLDLITWFPAFGNPGDRVSLNDMEEDLIDRMNGFSIEPDFKLFSIELESSTSLDNFTDTMNVFRQLVRYRIILMET